MLKKLKLYFQSIDEKAQRALECPCIAHLRAGPCGNQFSDAFLCFLKSKAEEKGSDCVSPFVALQSCIKANPNAFSKDVLEEDDDDVKKQDEVKTEETPKQEYRIIPPLWSVESKKTKRTKLQKALSLSFVFQSSHSRKLWWYNTNYYYTNQQEHCQKNLFPL